MPVRAEVLHHAPRWRPTKQARKPTPIQPLGTTPERPSGVGAEEREILRRVGLRSTPQRLAIVHEVLTRSHPTVGEIYQSVRSRFPTIGLQTVYNTLHTMTERGLVTELPFASATRFDRNTRPHANLVCRGCGRIEDAEFVPDQLASTLRRVLQTSGFAPDGQRIDVYGLCRTCVSARQAAPVAVPRPG